jgi:hypothetical protein
VANCREAHRDRVNQGRSAPSFSPGDLVFVRVQVNSNAEINRAAKLSYHVRGPFRIVSRTAGSYQVVPLHKPTATQLSYPGHMLSPVPPGILPCNPVDSPDFRYLKHGHAPLPNPLKRHLHIEQYNEVWFHEDPNPTDRPSYPARTIQPAVLSDSLDVSPFPSPASMDTLPTVNSQPPSFPPSVASPASLEATIASSSDRLFFISCTPTGTVWPRWYLVRVDLLLTAANPVCTNRSTSGVYHVHCLLQHRSDKALGLTRDVGGLSGTATLSARSTKLWNSGPFNSSLRLHFLMPRNLLLGLTPSLFRTLFAICLALSIFRLAFWLLIVTVLLPPTSGTASSPFASHVELSLLRSLLPHALLGFLLRLTNAPASRKPFLILLHPTGFWSFPCTRGKFLPLFPIC